MARQTYGQWDRHEWASEDDAVLEPAEQARADDRRWTKYQWVGDRGRSSGVPHRRAEEMPEGESALSGFRHNPATQHWGRAGREPIA